MSQFKFKDLPSHANYLKQAVSTTRSSMKRVPKQEQVSTYSLKTAISGLEEDRRKELALILNEKFATDSLEEKKDGCLHIQGELRHYSLEAALLMASSFLSRQLREAGLSSKELEESVVFVSLDYKDSAPSAKGLRGNIAHKLTRLGEGIASASEELMEMSSRQEKGEAFSYVLFGQIADQPVEIKTDNIADPLGALALAARQIPGLIPTEKESSLEVFIYPKEEYDSMLLTSDLKEARKFECNPCQKKAESIAYDKAKQRSQED